MVGNEESPTILARLLDDEKKGGKGKEKEKKKTRFPLDEAMLTSLIAHATCIRKWVNETLEITYLAALSDGIANPMNFDRVSPAVFYKL